MRVDHSQLNPMDRYRIERIEREKMATKDEQTRAVAARIARMCCPVCARPSCAITKDGFQLCWRCTHPSGDITEIMLLHPGLAPPPYMMAYKLDGSRPVVEVRHPQRG